MRALFIINPVSGKGDSVQRAALTAMHSLLADKILIQADVFYTRGKDDAKNKAAQAKDNNYDCVVAVGGDGTINEAVVGLYESNSKIPLAILPAGTVNDFAYSLGISPTADCLYDMVKNFTYKTVDIATFNGSFFLNVAAGGMLSDVAHSVPRDAKSSFGTIAYYWEGIKKLANLKFPTSKLAFTIDGGEKEIFDNFFFIITNSRSVGGFHKIANQAKLDDGYLDMYIVKNLNLASASVLATKVLSGKLDTDKHTEFRKVKEVYIEAAEDINEYHVDYDGENGGGLPLHVKVVPQAVNLLLPSKSKQTPKMFIESEEEENQ